jgi:hypothetical protein
MVSGQTEQKTEQDRQNKTDSTGQTVGNEDSQEEGLDCSYFDCEMFF